MFWRLLAVILAVYHTCAQSDHMQRYKRTLAQRADRALAAAAREQCGSISRKRPPRSAAQHYPLAGVPGRYTRLTDLHVRTTKRMRTCTSGCSSNGTSVAGVRDDPIWDANEDKQPFSESSKAQGSALKVKLSKTIPNRQPKWKQQGGDMMDSSSSMRRVARGLTDIQNKPEEVPEARVPRSDYSSESEEFSGEREGPQSANKDLWRADAQDVPAKWMTALYFSGQAERLKVNPAFAIDLPRSRFTLELWVKPEGGQNNPAIIAGGCVCYHIKFSELSCFCADCFSFKSSRNRFCKKWKTSLLLLIGYYLKQMLILKERHSQLAEYTKVMLDVV